MAAAPRSSGNPGPAPPSSQCGDSRPPASCKRVACALQACCSGVYSGRPSYSLRVLFVFSSYSLGVLLTFRPCPRGTPSAPSTCPHSALAERPHHLLDASACPLVQPALSSFRDEQANERSTGACAYRCQGARILRLSSRRLASSSPGKRSFCGSHTSLRFRCRAISLRWQSESEWTDSSIGHTVS